MLLIFAFQNRSSVAKMPATGFANYRVINAVPCPIRVKGNFMKNDVTLGYQKVGAPLYPFLTFCVPLVS